MVVHFICFGNTYRSRLAEAYLNSKKLAEVSVISSGVGTTKNGNRPISWLGQRLLDKYKLVPFQKANRTQTSKQLLNLGDLTIFFGKEYYQFCVDKLGFNSNNFEIWEIADLDPGVKEDLEKIRITEETFEVIRQKIDDLIERVRI